MLNFPKLLKWISGAVCFVFLMPVLSQAQTSPTSPAKGFQVVVRNNFEIKGSPHIHGGLAVGGTLILNGSNPEVMMDGSGNDTFKDGSETKDIGLIVEGGITYTSGQLKVLSGRYIKIKNLTDHSKYNQTDKIVVSKTASGWSGPSITVVTNEQNQASVNKDVFDFDDTFAQFIATSNSLKDLAENASFNSSNNTMQNTNSGVLNVLNLTSSSLSLITNEFKFVNTPSATYPVVINVDLNGNNNFLWNNPGFPGIPNSAGRYILWNFYNGNLTLNQDRLLLGTVFAPQSTVAKVNSTDIEGQLIAKNLSWIGGQIHMHNYIPPYTPPATTCSDCKTTNKIKQGSNYNGTGYWTSSNGQFNDASHEGVWYGELNTGDYTGPYYVYQEIGNDHVPIVPGQYVTFSVEMTSHAKGLNKAQMYLEFYNGSTWVQAGGVVTTNTSFANFELKTISNVQIPANTTKMRIVGKSSGNALKFRKPGLIFCYSEITLSVETQKNASCSANDGIIKVKAEGGSGQYQFSKDNAYWQDSPEFTGLGAGSYTIYVKDKNSSDAKCKKSVPVTLTKEACYTCTDCESVNLVDWTFNKWIPDNPYSFQDDGGYYVLNTNDNTNDYYVRQEIPAALVKPGRPYKYAVELTSHAKGGDGKVAEMYLEFFDGSAWTASSKESINTNWPDFVTKTISGTIPSGTTKIRVVGHSKGNALKFRNPNLYICFEKLVINSLVPTQPSCTEDNGTIKAKVQSGGSGQFTYTLKQGGTTITTADAGTEHTFTGLGGGTYTVLIKDKYSACDGSKEVTLTKPAAPTVSVDSKTICVGESATLTATCTGTVTWNTGATGSTLTVSPATTTTYTATCKTSSGCEASAEGKVTVNDKPEVSVDSKTICVGESATLTATCTGTVTWNTGATGSTLTVSPATTTTYTATCKTSSGCEASAEGTVSVSPLPTVVLETGQLTCEVKKVGITAAATGEGITYKWTVPAGVADPGNVSGFETSVPGVYIVEVTTSNGCKATDQIEVQQDKDLPTVTVDDKVMACGETEVTLVGEGSVGVTYSWTGPDGFTAVTKEITVSKPGTYTVTVTAPNGCTATAEGKVTKQEKPGPPTSSPHKVCYGEEVTLTATCASGTAKWYRDAALTQEITVLTFVPEQTHTYYVVCATQECVSEPTQSVVTVTPAFPAPALTATPEEVIKGESSTLNGSCETGTLVWYKDAALSEELGRGATLVVTPEMTTTYYAACEVEDCKKPSEVLVKVKDQIFDLALRKTIKGGGKNPVVHPGSGITFEIEVFNQGNVAASNIQVTDYIPTGLTLNDANWTAAGGKATLNTKIGSLAAGASTKVEITFTVNSDFTGKAVNTAEISEADGGDDIDSTPDDNKDNDGTPKDDVIDEDGKKGGDEDDHDYEEITVEETPVFDLALRKTLKAGQKTIFKPGDEVTFEITVFNQGNVDATDIDLVDYIPVGLTLSDANWTLDGDKARWTGAIPSLAAGGAPVTVSITFTLNNDAVGPVITNVAEISGAKNDKGLEDIDSTPDDNKDNDGTVKNDEINEDGKKGGDEDDHDIEPITVCPDQKCMTAKVKVKK